ncbi:alpha/beta hydrolase fold protein [Stanieria cyanosphaera PCC 7437]|uniref:Alpha/beta hydrolase fold protein n=1 Tax=Stanieria cyanosphaera (strain ATCC 29371 / PCC 7437) TaxID=111780 RepID=K9XS19_STAC7|nr:alpha/beta fold hydrolase [Stanieria cyanosphaera]AFZ34467.1 alpha/beta hydrolase fold protein [Stanieria cyanosphaera PCC 7437]
MKSSHSTAPVWINANFSFKRFDGRMVRHLSRHVPLAYWEYSQHQDEASSLEIALTLLHDYLKFLAEPVNLIGHSTGGLIGLLYARRYPHKVKSLTLLGVGCHPAIDWQAHYYSMRKLLPCSQEIVLARMVQMLFGCQDRFNTRTLIEILKQDLNTSPSSHSLYQHSSVSSEGVSMPLMVCGSENDGIVDLSALKGWKDYFKEEDILWTTPLGHHFFHYFFPEPVSRKVIEFWHQVDQQQNNFASQFIKV